MATEPQPQRPSAPTHPVKVRDGDGRADALYLARQWHHYFGVDYETTTLPSILGEIAGWSDDPTGDRYAAVAVHADTVRVGGALAGIVRGDHAVETIAPSPIDERALAGDGAVYISLVAVDAAFRDQGLGTRLLDACLDWATAQGVATVVAHSWQRRNHSSSAGLFERAGFHRIADLPEYYSREGAEREACPDCGVWLTEAGACECSAVLFAKDVA